MWTSVSAAPKTMVRAALLLVSVFFAAQLPAQSLRVTAANASAPNAVYDVLFSPAQTTLLNADGASFHALQSLVFVPGSNAGVDLIVADTAGGALAHYYAPTGTPLTSATVIWSAASQVPGPQRPDGLSVDAAGNLYVTTNYPRPQLWVLQPSPSAPGGYGAPVLLDDHFAGKEVDALVDSVVVPATLAAPVQAALAANGVHPGDVLVLVADTDHDPYDSREGITVFAYSAASIAARLANPGAPIAAPATALRQSQLPQGSTRTHRCPTGLDIWPVDGSLVACRQQRLDPPVHAARRAPAAGCAVDQGHAHDLRQHPLPDRTLLQDAHRHAVRHRLRVRHAVDRACQWQHPAVRGAGGHGHASGRLRLREPDAHRGDLRLGQQLLHQRHAGGIAVAPPAVVTPAADCVAAAGGCNPTGGLRTPSCPARRASARRACAATSSSRPASSPTRA